MPLVNVIRGERIDSAPLNVRTPFIRIPLWMALSWWVLRGLARLAAVYVRFWWLTLPATLLGWLYLRYGWAGPVALVLAVASTSAGWAFGHWPSFLRFGWWPLLGRFRRWQYRRVWHPAMVTAKLAVSFDAHTVLPILKKVRCAAGVDVVTVRMVTGQIPDDYAKQAERLAHTFGVRAVKAAPGHRPDLVLLSLMRGDPLAMIVAPLPVPVMPDFTALPIARQEDAGTHLLRLFGTQVLVVGATGAGKGSVIWSLVRALAGGVGSGLVQLWGLDPKGGMELGIGAPMFARFACKDFAAMAELLEEAAREAQRRAGMLRGRTRQHLPTPDEPLIVLVIDELANLTAYLTDRHLKDRIKAALGVLLTQGRAVGVHVIAAIQDPRKEVLPFRDLFPTRIGLRLSEEAQVDMVLGDGMRDRGALCDRIPQTLPGVGYVVLDGDPTPMRVRFPYLTDDEIRDLAHTYGRLRVIDGEVLAGAACGNRGVCRVKGKSRRAHGEGSVYEQRPGVWAAVVDLGWVDGKRKRKYVYAKTEAEAVKRRDDLRRQVQLGVDLNAPPRTVEAWLTEWLRDVKAHDGTRPSTLTRYRLAITKHLVPGLGHTKLDRLTPRKVQQFLTGLRDKLAPASIIKIHAVLRAALADAERLDLVPRNVAKAAKPPSLGRKERRALTPEEAKTLLAALTRDRLESFFVLALATGLRRGELLGLRWSDVDLSARVPFVRQTLQRTEQGLEFVPPKTHRSSRPLPLSGIAVRALERQRVRQAKERLAAGELWSGLGLVFASTIGTAMEPRNVNRRFDQLRESAGLEWLHLHDLRHAFATFLLDQGEELRTVMELLGHSTIRMTADTYGHVLPARARNAAEAIDRALGEEEPA